MTLAPSLVIGLPLATAAMLIALIGRIPRRVTQWIAIALGASTLAGTIALLTAVVRHGPIVEWVGGWHPGNRVGIGVALEIDVASGCVGVLVATVVLAAIVFSYEYFEEVGPIFYVLILAMLGAMVAFSYAADVFDLFVWYEVFSVAAYALATYQPESESAQEGALQFALTNSVAGLFFLVGITLLEGRTGELNLIAIGHSLATTAPHGTVLTTTALAFIAIALFTRGALAPLQFWFDEVHAAAPAPLSAILSGAMAPLALYGFARIYWNAFASTLPPSHIIVGIALAIGALSAIYGTIMALRESRFKRKLAHATVAHSGVALAAIGALTPRALAGAAEYEASYAAAAAALFFVIAIIRSRTGEFDIRLLTGAGRTLPFTAAAFAIATLAMAGLWTGTRVAADAGAPIATAIVTSLLVFVGAGTGGAFAAAFVRICTRRAIGVRVRRGGTPWFLVGPAVALALFSTAIAVVPGGSALAAWAAATLVAPATVGPFAQPRALLVTWLAPIGACLVCVAIVSRATLARRAKITLARNALYRALDTLDNGNAGGYIAWIVGSAAALSFGFSFAVK